VTQAMMTFDLEETVLINLHMEIHWSIN